MNEFFRESAGREWKSRYGGDEMSVTLGGKKKFALFRLLACSLSGLWWLGLPPSPLSVKEGGRKEEGGREGGRRAFKRRGSTLRYNEKAEKISPRRRRRRQRRRLMRRLLRVIALRMDGRDGGTDGRTHR